MHSFPGKYIHKIIQVSWLASKATFIPLISSGSMALGSTSCRGQRYGVVMGEERGTERQRERKGPTDGKGNVQGTAKG